MDKIALSQEISDLFIKRYAGIFYIDLERDIIKAFNIVEKFLDKFKDPEAFMDYSEFMNIFIEQDVLLDEQSAVRKASDIGFLRTYLREHSTALVYTDCMIEGEIVSLNLEYINRDPEGSSDKVLLLVSKHESKDLTAQFFGRPEKILVVEDDEIQRSIICDSLEDEGYSVIACGDGLEALAVLRDDHKEIACVITDYVMPNCDGYELILKMRSVAEYLQIPVIVATGEMGVGAEFKCLRAGATDFIYKPYDFGVLFNRIRSILEMERLDIGIKEEYYDELTGLLKKKYFLAYADRFIVEHREHDYYIVVSDIENFKSVNDRYGVEFGNETLARMAAMGPEMLPGYIMGGRLYNDVFVALIKEEDNWQEIYMENGQGDYKPPVPNLTVNVGAVRYDGKMNVQKMCDCAQIALSSIKRNIDINFALYDEKIKIKLQEEQDILNSMYEALDHRDFKLYFQPKHSVEEHRAAGAEVLVRWIHPQLGFMNPGRFIPLFEKNGFIRKMDQYIFEEACRTIREWQQEGLRIVPLSINISRRDFEIEGFAEKLIDLVDGYGIDHSLIHLEVTESAYTDDPENIFTGVRALHDAGFVIELDDFGTGYTSLTTLGSMDLDVMKLDISLVRAYRPDSERNTLDFAIQLARLLKLKTVAEGVETEEQKNWMSALGVGYIQGYYYSRPLTKEEFEAYISAE